MKSILILICTLFLLVSCQKNDQEKAEKLIKQSIDKYMPNPKSYEPIESGQLQKSQLQYEETYPYYILSKKIKENVETMRKKVEYLKTWSEFKENTELEKTRKEIGELHKLVELYNDSIKHEKLRFTFDTTRLKMIHRFRYYDEDLKKHIIESPTIYFDKDITKIVGIQDKIDHTNQYIYLEIENSGKSAN